MITVVDQVRPWLAPSSTLAPTQAHDGAQSPAVEQAGRSAIRRPERKRAPYRSDSVPAKKFVPP